MILTDTGVLIAFLRTKDAKLDHLLRTLPVAICGAVRAEIMAGTRNPKASDVLSPPNLFPNAASSS